MSVKTYLLNIFCLIPAMVTAQTRRVDGAWSEWSVLDITPCSRPCGGGVAKRIRSCSRPKPQYGGLECVGESEKEVPCNLHPCKDAILESPWDEWSACSKTCGQGFRYRMRKCTTIEQKELQCTREPELTYQVEPCREWNPFRRDRCPDPCDEDTKEYFNLPYLRHCPDGSTCTDISTEFGPNRTCVCSDGRNIDEEEWTCMETSILPTVFPVMSEIDEAIAVVITKTSSTLVLIMIGFTIFLFCTLRLCSVDRFLPVNMEIALFIAHLFLLFPDEIARCNQDLCRGISVCLHYFFTSCFMFSLLEALNIYAIITFSLSEAGFLNRLQGFLAGWGIPALIVIPCAYFYWDDYGGKKQCWLEMDKVVVYMQYCPIMCLFVLNLLLLEATVATKDKTSRPTKFLTNTRNQLRSNLILVSLLSSSWITGTLSFYRRSLVLYCIFSLLNVALSVAIFCLHSCGNSKQIRSYLEFTLSCCVPASSHNAK